MVWLLIHFMYSTFIQNWMSATEKPTWTESLSGDLHCQVLYSWLIKLKYVINSLCIYSISNTSIHFTNDSDALSFPFWYWSHLSDLEKQIPQCNVWQRSAEISQFWEGTLFYLVLYCRSGLSPPNTICLCCLCWFSPFFFFFLNILKTTT